MEKTRAMVLTGPSQLELREFPLPEIGAEDGLLKLELVGVCGSDPGIYSGKSRGGVRPYPIILGHEIVGRVARMGAAAGKRHGVREGDRVIIEYAFGCGRCRPCQEGRYTLCRLSFNYGSMVSCKEPPHLFGAYADYLYIHPNAKVHRIGEQLSPEAGVLTSAVLGNGVRWLGHIGGVSVGQAVAIVGPGQQGLAGVLVAREAGAGPIMVVGLARDRRRLDMALRFGADRVIDADAEDPVEAVSKSTAGRMADLVMDVSGHPAGASLALDLAGIGTRVVLPGLYGSDTRVPLLLDRAVFKEMKLLGVFSHDFRAVEAAIGIARRQEPLLKEMISHSFPLGEAERALRLVGGQAEGEMPLKVVLDPAL